MAKTHYLIEFIMHDFDYGDGNIIFTCWHIEDDYDSLDDAIKAGYDLKNKREYYSFIITKDCDLNQLVFDSKVYDETGKYTKDK